METKQLDIPDIFKNASFGGDQQSDDLVNQANTVIQNLTETYLKGVKISVEELNTMLNDSRQLDEKSRTDLIKGLFFRTAHDIKGQGATFGYPLMTALGAHICDIIRSKEAFSNDDLDTFQLDVDDMTRVLKEAPDHENTSLQNSILNRLKKGK